MADKTFTKDEVQAIVDQAVKTALAAQEENKKPVELKYKPSDLVINEDGHFVTPDELEASNEAIAARRKKEADAKKRKQNDE